MTNVKDVCESLAPFASLSIEHTEDSSNIDAQPVASYDSSPNPSSSTSTTMPIQQRLSSPERRKKTPLETKLEVDTKQSQAERRRQQLESERKNRARKTNDRTRTISEMQHVRNERARTLITEKLERADQIRDQHILYIRKKAETENIKVNEIAFITKLSTENKLFAIQRKLEESEHRRMAMLEEMKRKLEENAVKEEAALERKKALVTLKEQKKRTIQLSSVFERDTTFTQKSETIVFDSVLDEKDSATQTHQINHGNSRRIRQLCKFCEIEIPTDHYLETHLRGKKHKSAIGKAQIDIKDARNCIITIPMDPVMRSISIQHNAENKEKEKNLKQQIKSIRKRMLALSTDFDEPHAQKESPQKVKMIKLNELIRSHHLARNYSALEKTLLKLSKFLNLKNNKYLETNQHLMRQLNIIDSIVAVYSQEGRLPSSLISLGLMVLSLACHLQSTNIIYMITTNRLVPFVNLLERSILGSEEYHIALLTFLTLHLWQTLNPGKESEIEMKGLLIRYIITSGVIHKLSLRLQQFLPFLDLEDLKMPLLVEKICELFEAITAFPSNNSKPVYISYDTEKIVDSSISSVFKDTHFAGILSLLTSILLHKGPRSTNIGLSSSLISFVYTSIKILNNLASLDLVFIQNFLGSDDYQVEMFHLIKFLLICCTEDNEVSDGDSIGLKKDSGHHSSTTSSSDLKCQLLSEVILMIGYYTLQNEHNQEVLQWGKSPTILQSLCNLPFQYFSNARYKHILFPTLIVACFMNDRNTILLQQELNLNYLVIYLEEAVARTSLPVESLRKELFKTSPRFLLENRFSISLWKNAIDYFCHQRI